MGWIITDVKTEKFVDRSIDAYKNTVKACIYEGKIDKASEYIAEASKQYPDFIKKHLYLYETINSSICTNISAQDFKKANACLKMAIKYLPDKLYELGTVATRRCMETGKYESQYNRQALKYLSFAQKAIELAGPQDAKYAERKAYLSKTRREIFLHQLVPKFIVKDIVFLIIILGCLFLSGCLWLYEIITNTKLSSSHDGSMLFGTWVVMLIGFICFSYFTEE